MKHLVYFCQVYNHEFTRAAIGRVTGGFSR
jgi:hypothetical protein